MDELVKQALAKWPNVPHCYGWLGLDARGHWRMRDQHAQQQQLPGDKIAHVALLGFINRNYDHDERGCWFFQNGPQRVYLNLEATPYIARSDPQHGFVLQTGAPLEQIEQAYWCDNGALILRHGDIVAQVDDRDMAQVLPALRLDGQAVGDEALLAWLEDAQGNLMLLHNGKEIAVQPLAYASVPQTFGFQQAPQAE
ncbi:DUF2946 family protein [Janthinobacterium lividum]|jgi:hypothetical protein|uniref:DUF2946 family protein n=1 Tax=Janthinobacterium lividum TaxID=29581 RepID=UPI0008753E61|nr:DUF2946 family protein [Janthinobacterium lividum]MCC7715379.1 DUF2946 family protein [Janthinobacterium lividum]OEZ59545.1 hypothetical protein JANLI_15400 [Janthinobacterium lividum]WQE28591.1 DUF2946 family protein [Janthinobacterium lividum]STQ99538.1 Protein of uncharacterised function (DUF2946) [Janthinobacterium lividum]